MKRPLLRGWSDYHKPPTLDADPPSVLAIMGFFGLVAAIVAAFSLHMLGVW